MEFKISISSSEFFRLKNLRTMKNKGVLLKKPSFNDLCGIKMFEPFFKMLEERLNFNSNIETELDNYNYNILYDIPEFTGDQVYVKTDDNGIVNYVSENSGIKNVKLPLRNYRFKLKRISPETTFCYLKDGEYIVMKKNFAENLYFT